MPTRRAAMLVGVAVALVVLGAREPVAAQQPVPELREEVQRLTGRVDELSRQVRRQEQALGALAARLGVAASAGPAPLASDVPRTTAPGTAVPPTPSSGGAPVSSLPALIVMVGSDAGVTLQGRPVALPTLGFALREASGGDASRRVVVGAEPGVSPVRVGEVVGAVSQAGFGRITITGP